MKENSRKFKLQTKSGLALKVGEVSVTPQSQALTVRWPKGGWVWNRPHKIIIQQGEEITNVPVADPTRIIQLVFYVFSVLFVVIGVILNNRKRRIKNE